MIDFLEKCNLRKNTLNILESHPGIFDLNCNQEECIKIIDYFRKIGISRIDELLLNKMEIFYKSLYEIEEIFLKYNIDDLVDNINDNYQFIDEII